MGRGQGGDGEGEGTHCIHVLYLLVNTYQAYHTTHTCMRLYSAQPAECGPFGELGLPQPPLVTRYVDECH